MNVNLLRSRVGLVASTLALSFITGVAFAQSPLRAWGWNQNGQINVPGDLGPIVEASGGHRHTVVLEVGGTVRCWGANGDGQLNVPAGLSNVRSARAGSYHSIALRGDGTVVCWGRNVEGQCNVPVDLLPVVAIAGGNHFTVVLQEDGSVRAWGLNNAGQTSVPADLADVVAVSSGTGEHSLALLSDGKVRAWGRNNHGQCNVPEGLSGVVAVAAGEYHSIALKADGTLWFWGLNNSGQCTQPADLGPVVDMAGGSGHTIALQADGTVRAWGNNNWGQCNVPTDLGANGRIAAGYGHSLALAFRDCNGNGQHDAFDILDGVATDCGFNGIPDECDGDTDGDGTFDPCDGCPEDSFKTEPGVCGCGVPDLDGNGDGLLDCFIISVPQQYDTIQEAVNAAPNGATIEVGPGLHAGFVVEGKRVTVRSTHGPAQTIIEPTQSGAAGSPPSDAIVWPGNNHAYKVIQSAVSWTQARDAAVAAGGHLVSLGSQAENDFVRSLVPSSGGVWIGAFQPSGAGPEPAGGWVWVSGEPWAFATWACNQPDNAGNSEHCAELLIGGNSCNNARWNDRSANTALWYVIEWGSVAGITVASEASAGTIIEGLMFRDIRIPSLRLTDTSVVVRDCIFYGNIATSIDGGAIRSVNSTLECFETRFVANRAEGARGGDVSISGGSVVFRDCEFLNGRASLGGGSVIASNASVSFERCGFENYQSENGSGGVLLQTNGTAIFSECAITLARATGTSSSGGVVWSDGGAVTLEDCDVFDSTAGNSGGVAWIRNATLTLLRSSFENTLAVVEGGAIRQEQTTAAAILEVEGCSWINCRVEGSGSIAGGALWLRNIRGGIADSMFVDVRAAALNSAGGVTESRGGAIFVSGPVSGGQTSLTITGCAFADAECIATSSGGGSVNPFAGGGAIYATGSGCWPLIEASGFTASLAKSSRSGGGTARAFGGAMYFDSSARPTIRDCEIDGATADVVGGAREGRGGAIYAKQSIGTVDRTTIIDARVPLALTNTGAPVQWPENGHWYQLVTTAANWSNARAAAEAAGGYLVTITSAAENEFVRSIVAASASGAWAGAFQPPGAPEPGGGWTWVTGEAWSYTNWAPSEPNNLGGENHLQFSSNGRWNDLTGSSTLAYVIERDNYTPDADAYNDPASRGGAVYLETFADFTFRDSVFTDNAAGRGGVVAAYDRSNPLFVNCIFADSESGVQGGAIYSEGSAPEFEYSLFQNLESPAGGAMFLVFLDNGLIPSVGHGTFCGNSPDNIVGQWIDDGDNLFNPATCSRDCDDDGYPDDFAVSANFALDCNFNGVPDVCDLAGGTSLDENRDGFPDECGEDCNSNGVADVVEIAAGLLPDRNGDFVADGCQILDFVRLSSEAIAVEDHSGGMPLTALTHRLYVELATAESTVYAVFGLPGSPIQLEAAQGVYQAEAVGNLAGDLPCELSKSPPGTQYDSWMTIGESCIDIDQTITAGIDFTSFEQGGGVFAPNGVILVPPGSVQERPDEFGRVLLAQWTSLDGDHPVGSVNIAGFNADGSAWFAFGQQWPDPPFVDCNSNDIQDAIDISVGTSFDCDYDNVPDECQSIADCNANGIADFCDIANGTAEDFNQNGVPDLCECIGDIDQDGVVDPADILQLVIAWGTVGDSNADLNGDGIVGPEDLSAILSNYGGCL